MTTEITQASLEVFASKGLGPYVDLADQIKSKAAEYLDLLAKIPEAKFDGTVSRYKNLATTNIENSVMWAVKACSRV